MAFNMKPRDAWAEFQSYVKDERFDESIPYCGLCGNTGVIDTTNRVKTCGSKEPCGVRAYCICPNGRVRKRGRWGRKWGLTSVIFAEGVRLTDAQRNEAWDPSKDKS